ncbi:MAG: hypothetical protein WB586_10640 [Chthoniobacterales bacterium]
MRIRSKQKKWQRNGKGYTKTDVRFWKAVRLLPKLLIAGDPGLVIKGRILEFCRTWRSQTEVTVKGLHFLQEDSPQEIGTALRDFVKSLS